MKNNRKSKKKPLSSIQILIISIIAFLFVLIIGYIIFSLLSTTENITKSKFEKLASTYYENYLYEEVSNKNSDPTKVLEEYDGVGLSTVYLRQILYYEGQTDTEAVEYLSEHCDENNTSVKFYPESPYKKTSYHAEYSYSCDF